MATSRICLCTEELCNRDCAACRYYDTCGGGGEWGEQQQQQVPNPKKTFIKFARRRKKLPWFYFFATFREATTELLI